MNRSILKLVIFVILTLSFTALTKAQEVTTLECGQELESELTANAYRQTLSINVSAGTKLNIRVEPIGGSLNAAFSLTDSGGNEIVIVNNNIQGLSEELKN